MIGHTVPAIPYGNQYAALYDTMPTDIEFCMVCGQSLCLIEFDGFMFACLPT